MIRVENIFSSFCIIIIMIMIIVKNISQMQPLAIAVLQHLLLIYIILLYCLYYLI